MKQNCKTFNTFSFLQLFISHLGRNHLPAFLHVLALGDMTPKRPEGSHIQMKRILEYRDTVPLMGKIITVIKGLKDR
jgi:hypothetical protein